jgi:uncharacterized protein YraI
MSIKQKFISLGLATAMVFGGAAAAMAATAYAESPLNVRSGPGTQYRVVDVLQRGERVEVDYCRGSWCLVNKRGRDGWVSANYLSRGGSYYYDDYYYDDDFYIDRPRRIYRPRYRHYGPDFSACIGGTNARFCVYD